MKKIKHISAHHLGEPTINICLCLLLVCFPPCSSHSFSLLHIPPGPAPLEKKNWIQNTVDLHYSQFPCVRRL